MAILPYYKYTSQAKWVQDYQQKDPKANPYYFHTAPKHHPSIAAYHETYPWATN